MSCGKGLYTGMPALDFSPRLNVVARRQLTTVLGEIKQNIYHKAGSNRPAPRATIDIHKNSYLLFFY